jgi:hypothetical protein
MNLMMVAGFFLMLGVLVVIMASSQAGKDKLGRMIPPERAQIVALVLMIIGVGLIAYVLYGKAFG